MRESEKSWQLLTGSLEVDTFLRVNKQVVVFLANFEECRIKLHFFLVSNWTIVILPFDDNYSRNKTEVVEATVSIDYYGNEIVKMLSNQS